MEEGAKGQDADLRRWGDNKNVYVCKNLKCQATIWDTDGTNNIPERAPIIVDKTKTGAPDDQ